MKLSRLKKIQLISLVLAALMLWQYGGGRTYAALSQVQLQPSLRPEGDSRLANGLAESRFDELLAELKQVIRDDGAKTKAAPAKGFAGIERLNAIKDKLAAEDEKNQHYFAQLKQTISEKRLPAEIRERHAEFVRQYQSKYDALMAHVEGIESAHQMATGLLGKLTGQSQRVNWGQVIEQTASFLDANTPQPRPRQSFDPRNLPHRSLKADNPIPPKLTRDEWLKAFPEAPAASESAQPSTAGTKKPASPLATDPPVPADLAETIEVRFTPEIRQLADSLDRNPVKIYNWVRNNIEFVPTWGSIQGAQLCLETKRCNAFDTASLLIALLRYSGIPTRYQIGTIEVPIESAKNWLGGFTDPGAAARFAASGGIPSAGTVEQGGALRKIRMEHVWVKPYLDYVPSLGGINNRGDTWVDLDAGFKLYRSTPGADLLGTSGFDAAAFNDHLTSTTSFNTAEASITNVDHAFIESTFNAAVNNISNAFAGRDPNSLLPTRTVIAKDLPLIPTSSPYRILARGPATAVLPPELRHSIAITVTNANGQTLLTFGESLPALAEGSISLFYAPATQADVDSVRRITPPEVLDPTTPNRLERFLGAIPAFLIGVRPILQVDGIPAVTGNRVVMGEAQKVTIRFNAPTISTSDVSLDLVAWGRYGIKLDHAGISAASFQSRITRLESMVQQAQTGNGQGIAAPIMSRFYDLIASAWFHSVDQSSELLSRSFAVRFARYPSLAFSFPHHTVSTIFAVPNRIRANGYFLDAARQLHVVTALDGSTDRETGFNIADGFQSSRLEGDVLAVLMSRQPPPSGVSASSALLVASKQGIPLHAIDSLNRATVLPRIDSSYPRDSMSDAVNAGRVVFLPQRPPSINGQPANGYITLDPLSGDGSYLLGRTNGGRIQCDDPNDSSCQFWLGLADYLDNFISPFLAAVLIGLGLLLALAAAKLLIAAVGFVSLLAMTVVFLAAVLNLSLILVNLGDWRECLNNGPPPGITYCNVLLLRAALFGLSLDNLPSYLCSQLGVFCG